MAVRGEDPPPFKRSRTGGDGEESGDPDALVCTFSVPMKVLRNIIENVQCVDEFGILQCTPEDFGIRLMDVTGSMGVHGSFHPDFFTRFECSNAADVTVSFDQWQKLLKCYDHVGGKQCLVEVKVMKSGILHSFRRGGDVHGEVAATHTLQTQGMAAGVVDFAFADRAVEITVGTSRWQQTVDHLRKLADMLRIRAAADTLQLSYKGTLGAGSQTLKLGAELQGGKCVGQSVCTATHLHKMDNVRKAAKAGTGAGVEELLLRFVPDGPLEQHCVFSEYGRLCTYVCPTLEID